MVKTDPRFCENVNEIGSVAFELPLGSTQSRQQHHTQTEILLKLTLWVMGTSKRIFPLQNSTLNSLLSIQCAPFVVLTIGIF